MATVENTIDVAVLTAKLHAGVETIEDGEPFIVNSKLLGVSGAEVRLTVTEVINLNVCKYIHYL